MDRKVAGSVPFVSRNRLYLISDGAVTFPREHRNLRVDEIEHSNNPLPIVDPMQPPDVLLERAAPRDWHSQKQSVESRVVKALTDVASSGEEDSWGSDRNRGKLFRDRFSFLLSRSTFQDQYLLSVRQGAGQPLNVVCPIQRRTALANRLDNSHVAICRC
jgi:hypothetical protein